MKKIYTVLILLSLSATFLKAQVVTMPKLNTFPDAGTVIIAPTHQFNLGIFENDNRKTMGAVNSIANDYQKALIMLTQIQPIGFQCLGIDAHKIASSLSFGISSEQFLYYTSYGHYFSTVGKANAFHIKNNGNVGIGTYSPTENLHVVGNGKFSGDMWVNNTHKVATLSQDQTFTGVQNFSNGVNFSGDSHFLMDGPKFFEIKNVALNTFLQVGIAQFNQSFHRASKTGDIVIRRLGMKGDNRKLIISTASDAHDFPAQAVGISGANDVNAAGVWAHNNLNVRIGAYSATAPTHKLEVNGSGLFDGGLQVKGNGVFDAGLQVKGTIKTSEVIIEAKTADFVFEPDYSLRPLNEVETFIRENKHLPDVPSAAQMEKEGVGVAEMNKLLLQKIEELTLYVIELQKELQKLKTAETAKQ
ncbi:MAG: hypothetical protein LBV41_06520 [Cytophagaceae bacterium]|jgi:hypothetical protein|nr:hypothetical protein [Cytophagaceae bacterium]